MTKSNGSLYNPIGWWLTSYMSRLPGNTEVSTGPYGPWGTIILFLKKYPCQRNYSRPNDYRIEFLKIYSDPSLEKLRCRMYQYANRRSKRCTDVAVKMKQCVVAAGYCLIDSCYRNSRHQKRWILLLRCAYCSNNQKRRVMGVVLYNCDVPYTTESYTTEIWSLVGVFSADTFL